MKRQEELVQAARKEYPEWEEAQCHFIDGAHYADFHPHWISVEDEFPIDYEPVLAVVGGNHFAFVGICLNKKTWYCEIQNKATEIIGITHWCHLPQPPILSNSEKTGKNHLIDANNMVEHFRETTKMIEKGGEAFKEEQNKKEKGDENE